ncbi:MAG: hypothetical protein JNM63_19420, partial [Spirochaetia bacterium]|nr:hypothetical protein [Spirochaetia bacterium]
PNSQTVNITVRVSAQTATNAPFVNAAKVYEFGPAGLSFQDPVLARIHFDPSVIPPGYVKEDIHVFFRHHPTDPWQTLPTIQLDKSGNYIYANIYQFSEITAGFLSAPKDSQTRFNVNTKLPELKIPDPLSGKTGIKLPQPNIYGTLNQEIPIVVPQGREGLTPNVKLSYDSTRGNGLLGVGWSLEKDFFQRSTRNGIPSYTSVDPILYNGQELILTNSDTIYDYYRLKQESAFIFIRHHKSSDFFEVIKDGVVSKYGLDALSKQTGKSLEGLNGSFKWYLSERNRFNELAQYRYRDLGGYSELSEIEYGGNHFKIEFDYESRNGDTTGNTIAEIRHAEESGLLTSLSNRLSKIRVAEKTSGPAYRAIREYRVGYGT